MNIVAGVFLLWGFCSPFWVGYSLSPIMGALPPDISSLKPGGSRPLLVSGFKSGSRSLIFLLSSLIVSLLVTYYFYIYNRDDILFIVRLLKYPGTESLKKS